MNSTTPTAKVIALHRVEIETPCTASWAAMKGNDRVRHCGDCNKNVFNLSAMPEAEAASLLANNDGNLCVRFYRRHDGTVMTSDCSTSVRAATRRAIRRLPGAAGAALLAVSVSASAASDGPQPGPVPEASQPVMMMGAPPAPSDVPVGAQAEPQPVRLVVGRPSLNALTPVAAKSADRKKPASRTSPPVRGGHRTH